MRRHIPPEPGRCRTCNAPVWWCVTENGKPMPVDVEPRADGNLVLITQGPEQPDVAVVAKGDAPPDATRYVSHFVTCPQSKDWKKR